MTSTISQGPWTRIRPLQRDEVDHETAAAYAHAEQTWGGIPNNLIKTLGHCPALTVSLVPYANSFIFDIDTFHDGRQWAGFLDRPLKELCVLRTAMHERSRYPVTHPLAYPRWPLSRPPTVAQILVSGRVPVVLPDDVVDRCGDPATA